jgi:hypothetical protein
MLKLLAVNGGSILSKHSALFNPDFKYTHHQIVAGAIFDAIICTLLMAGMFAAAYRYWGPAAKRELRAKGGVDDSATLREEGMLLGLQPWVWSIIASAAFGLSVLVSILVYG